MADDDAWRLTDFTAWHDAQRWEVSVMQVGGGYHVNPIRGLMSSSQWSFHWNEYPSERRLSKAIARCQRWCDEHNAAEDRARAVVAAHKEIGTIQ